METIIFAVIILAVIGGAIALAVLGMRDSRRSDPLQDRLAEFAARGEQPG